MKRLIVTTAMLVALCACSEPNTHTYTAEEVFAANYPAGVYKGSGLNVGEFDGIKASVLSRDELRRYKMMIKVGDLTDLKIFFSGFCTTYNPNQIMAVETKMAAMFNPDQLTAAETKMGSNAALMEHMQAEAWERENSFRPYGPGPEITEFCDGMATRIRSGWYSHYFNEASR